MVARGNTGRPRFQDTKYKYYAMKGGLDLSTPAIEIDPGRCFDANNYEPNPVGGYRRINGHERFDGRTSPTSASYWTLSATITGALSVGDTLTGLASAATGKVLGIFSGVVVLGRVVGAYQSGEALQVGGTTRATSTSVSTESGAVTTSDDADYRLLAADDRRNDILKVPGSGRIRGILVYKDVVYAFRDNTGGTAGDMYKSTVAGWVQVTFGKEIQFTGAVGQISDGQTITGLTSGATATVVRSMLRTGTWTVSGVGTLVVSGVTGTFQNGEAIQVGGVTKVTSSSLCTNITRLPGGQLEAVNDNFTGSEDTLRMYAVDGVNIAFEFDGTNYIPIRTGMTTDAPTHISVHSNHLFLAFRSSLQYSGITAPYSWTLLTGANEVGMGAVITGLLPQTGNSAGASLAVFTEGKTSILYGSSSADFKLVPSVHELGYAAFTLQPVGNNTYGFTSRGVQSLITTLNYGDFNYAAISFLVQTYLDNKVGIQTCSTTLRGKNQYRLYFNDNTGIVIGLTGEKVTGIMTLNYGMPVRCMTSAKLTTGQEVCYFGSDDGYVYQDGVGTSFDGEPIEAWLRPAFNNLQSPMVRKQFRVAAFEVKCDGFARVNISYDIGYGTPLTEPAAAQLDQDIIGAGGYWDQFTFDEFTWDAPVVSDARISIDGTEKNISFLFYSNRAQDDSHTVQGVNLLYTPRRLVRSGT
jgi:hypothetical protein